MRPTLRIMITLAVSAFSVEARAAEICGNGIDDDSDGFADEQCYPTLTTGQCESPLSCTDTGMVSASTGSLRYSIEPDIAPRVPFGPGIGFRRFYLSQYAPGGGAPAYRTALGPRWGHTYATWIDPLTSPTRVVLHTTQGQDIMLTKTSSDATWEYFTPQPGHHYKEFKRRLASPFEYEIKTLTGESMQYDSAGRLKKIRDTLATPNEVLLTYDGSAQLSTVTDASNKRRLLFGYTSGVMTSMKFQIYISTTWTDQHTTTYGYTSGNLTGVTIGGQSAQTNVYTSNYLTSIQDGGGNTLVNFVYDGATAGKVVRVDTPRGVVGYQYAPSRTECTGSNKAILFFHKANTTNCNTDSDCATGDVCGGKTGAGATGQCFRGARCMTISSPSEDVITSVSAFAGGGQACDGACLDAIDHIWNTTSGALDLTAAQDPSTNYTVSSFNSDGLPTKIVYGSPNSTGSSTKTREVFMTYGNSSFPGRVTEVRRKSDLKSGTCSSSVTTGCMLTSYTFNSDGLLSQIQEDGGTLNASNAVTSFSYVTTFSFNAKGQVTQINGPLAGSDDVTDFEYWSGAGPLKDDFLQNLKRKKDSSNYVTISSLDFDFWGNAIALQDPDGTISCQTFDSARGYLVERRETMNGQTTCTTHSSDLVTTYLRNSALRLTKVTQPDGSCLHYEYDSRGRLSKVKRRDDCNPVSSGDTQEFSYSDDGLLIKAELKDSAGTVKKRQELTHFDSRRLEKMINPVNTAKWMGLQWNSRGLLESIAAVDGGSSLSRTDWTFDAEGRVASEKRYTAGSAFDTWSLLFSWLGDQRQVTDGDSKATTSSRDDLGRMVRLDVVDDLAPTLRVFNALRLLVTVKEVYGTIYEQAHAFTFDNLGRPLTSNYAGDCRGVNNPDITRIYDTLSGGPSCPVGATCTNLGGRLAYVKAKLMCDTSQGDDTLDQETWYGYDAAGRLTHEYISDDTGRTASHVFAWTKNGAMKEVTLPSGTVLGTTFGSGGSNSDTDRITKLWRTNSSTPIIDSVLYEPFGPVSQYNQQNSPGTGVLRTRIARNLAYRQTLNIVEKTDGTNIQSSVTVAEDNKGRTTQRDYYPSDPTIAGRYDSFYQYDLQDRVLCEATTSGTCPTSGSTLKNNHSASPPFEDAGDWKNLLRPIPGSTGLTHALSLYPGTHFHVGVNQSSGTPTLGNTQIDANGLTDRYADDNTSTLTHDYRRYRYDDGRRNVTAVRGEYKVGASWHFYDVVSAFDAKNRRVFKSFYNETTMKTATWFFYYDALDRLTEVKYTPDTSSATTYSTFQLVWLESKLITYWQTDYPSVTTSKRYVSTDETNHPIDMMTWPASGSASRVWTVSPDAWGNDRLLAGAGVFQPILLAGQYIDIETIAWMNDGTTKHRPGIVLNGFRSYDPWIGSYLQVDPLVDYTWNSFTYANSNPVGNSDPKGLSICMGTETPVGCDIPVGEEDGAGYCSAQCYIACLPFGWAPLCDCDTCHKRPAPTQGGGGGSEICPGSWASDNDGLICDVLGLNGCHCNGGGSASDPVPDPDRDPNDSGQTPPGYTPPNLKICAVPDLAAVGLSAAIGIKTCRKQLLDPKKSLSAGDIGEFVVCSVLGTGVFSAVIAGLTHAVCLSAIR